MSKSDERLPQGLDGFWACQLFISGAIQLLLNVYAERTQVP